MEAPGGIGPGSTRGQALGSTSREIEWSVGSSKWQATIDPNTVQRVSAEGVGLERRAPFHAPPTLRIPPGPLKRVELLDSGIQAPASA